VLKKAFDENPKLPFWASENNDFVTRFRENLLQLKGFTYFPMQDRYQVIYSEL